MTAGDATATVRPRRRHLPIRWSLVLATIAVLATIVALRKAEPSYEDKIAPIPVHGRVGERIVARNFAVTLKRAKLARAYQVAPKPPGRTPRIVRPDGIWMSALVEVEALAEPGAINAQLRTRDGLFYVASPSERPDIGGSNLRGRMLATGLPGTGGYFFDVAPDRLEGAHLQFFWNGLGGMPEGLDHIVDIDLGLDAAATRKLLADAKPLLVLQ